MKLIEALKKIKELTKKTEDLRDLVKDNCALSNIETPKYDNTKAKIKEWVQSHSDTLKEILRLRVAIQLTNLKTDITIEIDGKTVTKSIAEWIHRRRDLATEELKMWSALTDRNIKEGLCAGPAGSQMEIKIVRFYDPEERDSKRALFRSEPMRIDAALEIANAVTDIIEQ